MPETAAIVVGHEGEAEADGREQRRPEDVGRRSRRRPRPGRTRTARPRRTRGPTASTGLKPIRVTSCEATPADEDDRDRQRQVGEAGLDRAVAQHLLHVEGDEEEHREQRCRRPAGRRRSLPVSVRLRKMLNGTSGACERRSITAKAPSSSDRSGEQPDRLSGAPAGALGVDDRVDEQREAGRDGHRAGDVEGAGRRLGAALRDQAAGSARAATSATGTFTQRTHSQPRPSVSTPPSRTPAAPPEPATAPHAPSALLRSAPSSEDGRDDGERARRDDRRAEPLRRPCRDQRALARSRSRRAARRPRRSARPTMNIRRRPSRSAIRPPSSRNPPKVST